MGFFRRRQTSVLEQVANAPVGAAVVMGNASGHIAGTVVFEESGDRWVEHLLHLDDGYKIWVSIENFSTTVATQWSIADPSTIDGGPNDSKVVHDGVRYARSEAGQASWSSKGNADMAGSGSVDYVDFEGPDGRRLGWERYGEVGARRRSIAVAGNCPNCGAPLQVDATGRCVFCSAMPVVDDGQWDEWEVSSGIDVSDRLKLA